MPQAHLRVARTLSVGLALHACGGPASDWADIPDSPIGVGDPFHFAPRANVDAKECSLVFEGTRHPWLVLRTMHRVCCQGETPGAELSSFQWFLTNSGIGLHRRTPNPPLAYEYHEKSEI